MNIEIHQIIFNSIKVDVVRKGVKNQHLDVYPPNGRVRVAALLAVSDDAMHLSVFDKLS